MVFCQVSTIGYTLYFLSSAKQEVYKLQQKVQNLKVVLDQVSVIHYMIEQWFI